MRGSFRRDLTLTAGEGTTFRLRRSRAARLLSWGLATAALVATGLDLLAHRPLIAAGQLTLGIAFIALQIRAELDGCVGDPALGLSGVTMSSTWNRCKAGAVVRLDTIVDGRHTWFGCGVPPCDPVPGEPGANAAVWNFFNSLRPAA